MSRLLLLALLAACGGPSSPELSEYAAEFYAEASSRGVQVDAVPLYFVQDLDGGVAAECVGGARIRVSQKFWDRAQTAARRSLVFHELGHCALGLDHSDHGIMRPKLYWTSDAEAWSNAVEELFQ